MLYRFILIIGILLFTFSCGKEEERECSGICTEEFRSISIEVTNAEGNPVFLDSIALTDMTNNREINLNSTENVGNGFYSIFNDNLIPEYKNEEINLLFKGFEEGNLILEQEYKVGAGCCHIYHVSGPLEIQLDF